MTYLRVGDKKLGVEFAFAQLSYLAIFLITHFVTLRSGLESYLFYGLSLYVWVLYVNIAFCNPGRLTESQKA